MSRLFLASITIAGCLSVGSLALAQGNTGGQAGGGLGGGPTGAQAGGSATVGRTGPVAQPPPNSIRGGSVPPAGSAGEPGGPLTSDDAASATNEPAEIPATDPSNLLNRRGNEFSVGVRAWVMHLPSVIAGIFARVEPGWGGATGFVGGPEFIYRNNGLDIVIGIMYADYSAGAGYFRGLNESPNATEQVRSSLFGVYLTSHFMWGIRLHRMFEIQIGGGIGLGYIGGDLFRSQAYQDPPGSGMWRDCVTPGTRPGSSGTVGAECMSDNTHYSSNNYREPGIFDRGSVPTLMPWVSLPQIAFHVRPHRNFDFKIEGGYALIGFYGGGSLHVVF